MVTDTAYFTLYKDSFKLIASKKITLMKESGNLPSADTRILPEILASHKDVESSWLNVVCWIKTSMTCNVCEDDGCRGDVAEREIMLLGVP